MTPNPKTTDVTRTCQPASVFTTAGLLAALEQAWADIRVQHPEVPAAVLVVGSGSPAKASQYLKYGHFADLRWQHGEHKLPEVLVSGEGLSREPDKVFTTLLHEAAHGLATARGIKDTSRQGRWHNKQFAKLADELGMTTTKDDKLGFSPCALADTTRTRYQDAIGRLTTALGAYRHPEPLGTAKGRTNNNNGVSAECECPRKIRVAASVLDQGLIACCECGTAFLPEDTEREDIHANLTGPACPHENEGQAAPPDNEDPEDPMVFYDPTGERYGLPTYPFKFAPAGLATRRQLRAQNLRPGGQEIAAQILWRKGKRVAYLYRIDAAKPKRAATPAQLAAVRRALTARRTCPTCLQVRDYYIPRSLGECLNCAPGGAA